MKRSGDAAASCELELTICVQCQEHLQAKSSTASCHIQHKHPSSLVSLLKKGTLSEAI